MTSATLASPNWTCKNRRALVFRVCHLDIGLTPCVQLLKKLRGDAPGDALTGGTVAVAQAPAPPRPVAKRSASSSFFAKATRKPTASKSAPAGTASAASAHAGRRGGPPCEKMIVFSQWTGLLDLVEPELTRHGFQFRRVDGRMTLPQRETQLGDFDSNPQVTVLLLSLRAASLGLNLVVANHVVLLDLWWNPTVEDQAIDRTYRIGQTRPVKVTRITIKDTVEDRILELQLKKREIVLSTFGAGGGAASTQLTRDDLLYLFS